MGDYELDIVTELKKEEVHLMKWFNWNSLTIAALAILLGPCTYAGLSAPHDQGAVATAKKLTLSHLTKVVDSTNKTVWTYEPIN